MAFRLVVEHIPSSGSVSNIVDVQDCTSATFSNGLLDYSSESGISDDTYLGEGYYRYNNSDLSYMEWPEGWSSDVSIYKYDNKDDIPTAPSTPNNPETPEIPEDTPTGEVYLYTNTVLTNGSAVNDVSVTLINKSSKATLVEEDGHYTFTYPLNSGNIPLPEIEINSEKYKVDGWVRLTSPASSDIYTSIDSDSDLGSYNEFSIRLILKEFSLTLSPSNLSLTVGETGFITATTDSQQSITWSSNNTEIVTVNSSGNSASVTAISEGTTTITASIGAVTESCTVTVLTPSEYTLKIYDDTNINIIKTITIPKGELINKCIYETGVYNEINDKEAHKDGHYISEWINYDTDDIILEEQTMVGDLNIYPGYTEIKTKYYSAVSLPNLIQRFPFGAGSNYSLGDKGGEETVKLTINEMPSHNHNLSYVDSNRSNEKRYYSYGQELDPSVNMGRIDTAVSDDQYMTGVSGVKDASGNFVGSIVTKTGAGGSHNNMPPYLVVNFIIKYQ